MAGGMPLAFTQEDFLVVTKTMSILQTDMQRTFHFIGPQNNILHT